MRDKPILCVDFDGVIHSYTSGWKGETIIPDPPVPGALRWLWKATEWFNVQVYSSRSKQPAAIRAMRYWMAAHSADEFGHDHPMAHASDAEEYPIVFAYEKPAAFLTIDDRAICFEGDWNDLEPADLLNFKPWNKREITLTEWFVIGPRSVSEIETLMDEHGAQNVRLSPDGIAEVRTNSAGQYGKPSVFLNLVPEDAPVESFESPSDD